MTLEEGKKLQAQELESWKKILKIEVYEELYRQVVACDKYEQSEGFLRDGHDICRGDSITSILLNIKRLNL